MTETDFLVIFCCLAVADWYMDNLQSTSAAICKANGISLAQIGPYLNPDEVAFAFPVTLAKWALVVYYAVNNSVGTAIAAQLASSGWSIFAPLVPSLAMPRILAKISQVRVLDASLAEQLSMMVRNAKL